MSQIISTKELREVSHMLHQKKKRIVLLGGCFDIVHVGHIALLEGAKKQGDIVIVLLESDKTITVQKGEGRPIHTQMQRAIVLSALRFVDYVVLLPDLLDDSAYDELTRTIQPAIIATTENDPGVKHKIRQAENSHAKVVFVNKPIQDVSTTKIANKLGKEI